MESVHTGRNGGRSVATREALRATATAVLLAAAALSGPAVASAQAIDPSVITSLLSPASGGKSADPAGKVQRIDIGSKGATVTLEGGRTMQLDFSGLTGVGGGPNYAGWAMLLVGMSVVARLLSAVGRVMRPFGGRRRRRDDYD